MTVSGGLPEAMSQSACVTELELPPSAWQAEAGKLLDWFLFICLLACLKLFLLGIDISRDFYSDFVFERGQINQRTLLSVIDIVFCFLRQNLTV